MTEKVRITQKQADAIKDYTEKWSESSLVIRHNNGTIFEEYDLLYKLNVDTLIRALYIGYEVEPEFKVGDWVVHDSEQGAEVVKDIKESVIETNERSHFYYCFRYATPEEIAEKKEWDLWDSIDREVGDFTEGDLGIYRNGMRVSNSGDLEKYYESGDLIGFYPAESFVNLGDGDSNG